MIAAIQLPQLDHAVTRLAAIVIVPVRRLESHYFALATLGIAQVLLVVAIGWIDLTGGANGLAGIPELSLGGGPPEQLGEFQKAEIAKWAKVVKAAGVKQE